MKTCTPDKEHCFYCAKGYGHTYEFHRLQLLRWGLVPQPLDAAVGAKG